MSSKKKSKGKAYKKKSTMKSLLKPTAGQVLHDATTYPIIQCLIPADWRNSGLANVIITREQPDGRIVFGNFLVDIFCLGVKNCFVKANMTKSEYEAKFLAPTEEKMGPFVDCDVALAHAVVYGAVDYARSLGFEPHPDYAKCRSFLEPKERLGSLPYVEFGKDGKPFYISGPNDDAEYVLETLSQNVGEGNYDSMLGIM